MITARLKKRLGAHPSARWPEVLHAIVMRIINKLVFFRILRCRILKVEDVPARFLGYPEGFVVTVPDAEGLRDHSDIGNELTFEFAEEYIARGDTCLLVTRGEEFGTYIWYTKQRVEVYRGLHFEFAPGYFYTFKGFTNPAFRGLGLLSRNLASSFDHFSDCDGMLALVESTNIASYESLSRVGFQDFGRVFILRFRGRYYTRFSLWDTRYEVTLD